MILTKNIIFVKFARDLDTPLGRSDTKAFEKAKRRNKFCEKNEKIMKLF